MKKMEKLIALACTLAMGVSLAACAPSGSGSTPSTPTRSSGSGAPSPAPADKIVLRYADTVNDNDVDGLGAAKFNELVQEATNGQVEIQWYGSGTLGSDIDITQACISGTVDIAKCTSGNLAGFSSALAWTELPGLFNSLEECRNVLNSDIRDTIVETMYNDIGCYPLMLDIDGGEPRCVCSNTPVYVPSDLAGTKLRSTGSEVEMALFSAWEAGSTPVAFSELYSAMQQNMIDGYYLQPAYVTTSKLEECTGYFTYNYQSWVFATKMIGPAAIQKLGGLDSELFKTVADCARQAEEYKVGLWGDLYAQYRDTITAAGKTIIDLNDEQMAQWNEASASIWDQFVGSLVSQEFLDHVKEVAKG